MMFDTVIIDGKSMSVAGAKLYLAGFEDCINQLRIVQKDQQSKETHMLLELAIMFCQNKKNKILTAIVNAK